MKYTQNYVSKLIAVSVLIFVTSGTTYAEKYVIDQKNKRFSDTVITIKKGQAVDFTNSDPMPHNIHSAAGDEIFDLGSYRKGEVRTHVFKTTGRHEIECAIHPFMFMTVKVE